MPATLSCCNCGYDLAVPDIKPLEHPFPELINLGSNHVLTPPQSDIIFGSISSALHDIAQLEQGIFYLENRISELRLEREERLAFATAHKALVSPLRRTPPEIFTEIFLHCVGGSLEHPNPTLLASICSRWRSIALSSPELWASLRLIIKPHNLESQTALATMWLSRAGTHPLSICLDTIGTIGREPSPDVQSLMDVLLARCEQWRTLELTLPTDLIKSLLGATNRLDRLEKLTLGDNLVWDVIQSDISGMFATAPRLRSLKLLHLFDLPQLPWRHLRELFMNGEISAHSCLDVLKTTFSLQKCDFFIMFTDRQSTHAPSSITLPMLQSLSVGFTRGAEGDLPYFLSAMCLPSIQELSISANDPAAPFTTPEFPSLVADALVSVIAHGSLLKLALGLPSPAQITPASTISILRAAPKLLELTLMDGTALVLNSQVFIDYFNAPDAHLVPNLQTLDFECLSGLDISTALGMIEGSYPRF
ncbi:hypothetical protein FIBSPDRAFT_953196 [Athelia psychrophila]|uniref:F-box domain-containing protein n=1 Tax=Athelia psychrophila TaxID=1759441 RepID=A0A166KNZ5_9AGAM|nr:hypothetical protein FIBSPDRAFT_953196 [Fibularhizoctonia sp. CBS 109695]